jgi:ubiquinone/menaquinone biosynthesis C-methylase UbiE
MLKALIILLCFLVTIIVISVIWRFVSRKRSLPCPTWLGWLLKNPFATESAIARLELQPGMKVLDAGCGWGRLTIPIARAVGAGGEVTGIDIQHGMLDKARKRAEEAKLDNIRFIQAGAGENKIERGKFDRALLVTVLGEIPDRPAALKDIFGSLKPGGFLSITEIIFDPHFQPRKKVRELAALAGFRERKFFGNRFSFTMNLEKPLS